MLMTQQKPVYITSAMVSAYLDILPRAMICFFNSWDYLSYLHYIIYLQYAWTGETKDNISDHLVSVSSGVLVIVEHNMQL